MHKIKHRISEAHEPNAPSSSPLTRMHVDIVTESFECCVVSRKYSIVAIKSYVFALILGASIGFFLYVSVAYCSV